jgi:hypothetical protein
MHVDNDCVVVLLSTSKDCAIYIYTRCLISLVMVYGGLWPSMAISDVEASDSNLPESRSM